jgi:hypothetical protein
MYLDTCISHILCCVLFVWYVWYIFYKQIELIEHRLIGKVKGILSTSCVIFSYPKLLSISVLTFIKWRLNTELLMNTLRNVMKSVEKILPDSGWFSNILCIFNFFYNIDCRGHIIIIMYIECDSECMHTFHRLGK